jgi:C4-dicarboxylate-specific signal transduction histidine kinase
MVSEARSRYRQRLQLMVVVLLACACAALAVRWSASPRGLTIAGLLGGALLVVLWRKSGRLARTAPVASRIDPTANDDPERQPQEQEILEARLEHAPVALFNLHEGSISPLNIRARRAIAPGYASQPQALYRQLQGTVPPGLRLISFDTEHGTERALVSAAAITVSHRVEQLLALMPIESELEAATLRAWQQLVHVLTHEIMNSLTSIASLSKSAHEMLQESLGEAAPTNDDLSLALTAIATRAGGLMEFVTSYRSLSSLPEARIERVTVADLLSRVAVLSGQAWRDRGGEIIVNADPPSLVLMADANQIEQALLSLVRNAFEATVQTQQAKLELCAYLSRGGRLCIEVADNGPGVPDEIVSQIFTPFYSTKARSRGIGLALVRQLVHGNGGTVRYIKGVGGGARFRLTF